LQVPDENRGYKLRIAHILRAILNAPPVVILSRKGF
jgi:hypothetical protein